MRSSTRLKKRTIILAILLILGGSLFVAGSSSHAATVFSVEPIGEQTGLAGIDLKQLLINIIRWVLGIVTLAAVGYMIYGGILWMTSAGNEQRIEKAKQVILQAAIGLVIILLAWAIVFFVTKTLIGVTTNSGSGSGCAVPPCGCGLACPNPNDTFDITAVTSCAEGPNYSDEVPLSSGISFTFSSDLEAQSVLDAFNNPGNPGEFLRINKCSATAAGYDCGTFVPTTPLTPKEIEPQSVAPGTKSTGAAGATKAEWVVRNNTLTFYHLSFSDDPANADNRWFEEQTNPTPHVAYRITIPRQDPAVGAPANPDALTDTKSTPRRLVHCQRPGPSPIIGDSFIGEHCIETANEITWEFTTGNETIGQPLLVSGTTPSSDYLTDATITPARNIPRNPTLGINFDGGLDPGTADMENFEILPFTTPPTQAGNWADGVTGPALPASDFNMRVNSTGTGVWVQYKQTASCAASLCSAGPRTGLACTTDNDCPQQRLFESFTWYKIVAKDFRNLCGTLMQPPTLSWVFETNDVTPGVAQVYPNDGFQFACPTTRVFVQFNTSMWDITEDASKCSLFMPSSYNLQGELDDNIGNQVMSRTFTLKDPVPVGPNPDPNAWCKIYEFDPSSAGLPTGDYHGGITSTLLMDAAGTMLTSGDQPPLTAAPTDGKGWGFSVKPPDQCYQPPTVTTVSPGHDINGACVSVIGDYFTDPANPPPATTYPRANDLLNLGSQLQSVPATAWQSNSIVSLVSDVGLTPGNTYNYEVTVDYPAPIGPLTSATHPNTQFTLDVGPANTNRPCLLSVNPNQGYPGQPGISANGKYFGAKVLAADFLSTNPGSPAAWSSGAWTDTSIANITVDPGAFPGIPAQVQVRNSANRLSNELPFTVQPPPPIGPGTAPEVVESNSCAPPSTFPSPNPYRDDAQACINAKVIVGFNVPLDGTTVDGSSVELFSCTDATTCLGSIPINAPSTTGNRITFEPTADLTPGTLYEGRLSTGIRALPAPLGSGLPMAAQYTWQFTTKAGPPCDVDTLNLTPNGAQTTNDANYSPISMLASPLDTSCHALKLPAGKSFNWSVTNPTVGDLWTKPLAPTPDDIKSLAPPPPAVSGNTVVQVGLQSLLSPTFTLTYNPTACTDDGQCQVNPLCTESICDNGFCTPVITGVDKPDGKAGAYNTILGCWFGNVAGTVHYGTEDGIVPDPLLCGTNTWTNEKIIREVPTPQPDPDFLGSVDVVVTRPDLQTATRNNGFEYSGANYPTMCGIIPVFGYRLDSAKISGKDFGTPPPFPASGRVDFTQDAVAARVLTYPAPGWQADGNGITVQVPALAAFGSNEVRVTRGGETSNPVSFNVLNPSSSVTCATPCLWPAGAACLSLPGQACTYNNQANGLGCCAPRPQIIGFQPEQDDDQICRNTVSQITFDLPLDPSTVTAGPTGTVQYQDGATVVNGSVVYRTTADNEGQISYHPGLLSANSQQQMSLLPNRIRGANGVLADISDSPLRFTTGDNICTVDRVDVQPANTLFTAVGETASLEAQAYSNTQAAAIAPVADLYSWKWSWASRSPAVATAVMSPNDPDLNPSGSTITAVANGNTSVTATTTVDTDTVLTPSTVGRTVEGQSDVSVSFCVDPWIFIDNANNCDINGLGCKSYNFRLFYCRDAGATPLPDFSYNGVVPGQLGSIEGINASDPTRLKTYFFKESAISRDTIGLMIFRNDGFLSPYDWFKKRFPLDNSGSSTVVGNYPAVKSGTTTYIGVTNYRSGNLPLEGLMFLFDYNSNNASPETVQISEKMLDAVMFDLSLTSNQRDQLIRDTRRRQDLTSMQLLLNTYRVKNGTYPTLVAGSYIPGFSTSMWPSWQAALGSDLATTAPSDPVNKFSAACAAPYEAATCWSETKKEFICPPNPPNNDSSIYAYKLGTASSANLYATMEFSLGSMASFKSLDRPSSICASPSSCDCFNFTLPVTSASASFVLQNSSFETVGADGVPTGWLTGSGVTSQSDDVPPGNEDTHSALVDCSGCTIGQQSYVTQTQAAMDPIGTIYHVTGWVKTENPPKPPGLPTWRNWAGLFTACMDGDPPPLPTKPRSFNNCGYDLGASNSPGIFTTTAGSGGWKYIDFSITKRANSWATLHLDCFADAGNKAWCDDITVTRVDG